MKTIDKKSVLAVALVSLRLRKISVGNNMKRALCVLFLAMLLAAFSIGIVAAQPDYTIEKAPTETDCIAKKTKFEHAERAFINNTPAFNKDAAFASTGSAQLYYGFGFPIPTGATIQGIEIKLAAWVKTPPGGEAYFEVSLSWNGGDTYTSSQKTDILTSTENTYILGGSTDCWGRDWDRSEFSDENFRVKLLAFTGDTLANNLRLDYIAVKIYYTEGPPGQVDLGGTIGFWKNWNKHKTYTKAEIEGWLATIDGASDWLGPCIVDGMVSLIKDATGKGTTMEKMFLAQYLALRLDVESERISATGTHDVSKLDLTNYLGLTSPSAATVAEITTAIESKYGTFPSRAQFEIMKNICDALNNLWI